MKNFNMKNDNHWTEMLAFLDEMIVDRRTVDWDDLVVHVKTVWTIKNWIHVRHAVAELVVAGVMERTGGIYDEIYVIVD